MKAKKLFATLLSCALVCGSMTGCQKEAEEKSETSKQTVNSVMESTSSQTEAESSLFNTDGELPIVNEPITLKVLTQDVTTHATGHIYTSKIWDWLTEQTGIKFEIETYSKEDLKTKIPLIMAGDELPDIFLRCDFSYGDLESYASAGKILAMDDLVEEYGYYTKQLMEEREDTGVMYAADGHIYGLPTFNASKDAGHPNFGINQEWLDNLGLQVPETMEQLYDVLVAFRDQDANGNGDPNDEIPMSVLSTNMQAVNSMNSWVGIATYWPVTGVMFDDKDGEVYMVRTSDNYRYLLTWLNKFYEEGLLDSEVFTQASAELTQKREENRLGVTSTYGKFDYTDKACGKELIYTGLVLGSEVSEPVCGTAMSVNPNLFSISATTEYPEICFLLGDYFYSEEASWLSNYGVPGVNFEWTDEANYQFETITNAGNEYSLMINRWIREDWAQNPTDDLIKEYKEKVRANAKVTFQNYLVFSAEENDEISRLSTDMATVLDEYYVHFITGEKDIETEWDDYVKLVESLNLKELTELYQTAYDRLYAD